MPAPLFVYLMGPASVGLLWGLRSLHVVYDLPLWAYAALWIGPTILSTAASTGLARRPSRAWLEARAATDTLATTAMIYATGWGPALGLAYLVAAQQLVAATDARSWKVCRRWSLLGIGTGQLAIALGLAPTLLRPSVGNGVAVLGAFAFLLVSRTAETISSDRERAWNEVHRSEQRFRALVDHSSDLIVVVDTDGKAMYASGATQWILGLTEAETLAADLSGLVHPDDVERVHEHLADLPSHPGLAAPVSMRIRHATGTWRQVEATVTNLVADPAVGGFVLNVRDVTERKAAEERLVHLSLHDPLTGLANRVMFLDRLAASMSRASKGPGGLGERGPAVLFLDLDRFKVVNDSLGHDVGDRLLVQAADRLRRALRSTDAVARFGGDEFVVLCEWPDDAERLAERLLGVFEDPFRLDGDEFRLSVSIGLARPTGGEVDPGALIRDADAAMYRAKEAGRNRLETFDDQARSRALERIETENALRGAAERGELRLHYQPIVDLHTGEVVATEALLRWDRPRRGLVGPGEFIDIAEESGLILPIGDWVLREATSQASAWATMGAPIDMTFNASARQLATDDFIGAVQKLYSDPGAKLNGARLTMEVTESALIEDPAATAERIGRLKALGFRLSIDDFGTGYSSVANLRRYPFDALKIDRRFVAGMTECNEDLTVVRALIGLAHGLGLVVVAEGVETPEQLALLQEMGCDQAQGFLLGRPQPPPLLPSQLLDNAMAPRRSRTSWIPAVASKSEGAVTTRTPRSLAPVGAAPTSV